tara:strand:+ start:45 stop:356 length:312 start_codon:yes stop_codon:yes gene_type:complete
MSIKIVLLKSGEQIISDAKELVQDDVVHGYLLNKPHTVSTRKSVFLTEENDYPDDNVEISLAPWILLTSDDDILVPKDWIVTIVEPLKSMTEMYQEKVNGQGS